MTFQKELQAMKEAAVLSSKIIKEVYESNFDVEIKDDNSPVTEADKKADAFIRSFLHERFPTYAFLTEESKDDLERLKNDYVFIVDPVDGTKEFVARNGEFTTNIALAYKHQVVAAVINAPILGYMYTALKDRGAYLEKADSKPILIHVSDRDDQLRVLVSRSFKNEEEEKLINKNRDLISSVAERGAALKFGAIAEGTADLSYRMSARTKEWDIAAGVLIVKEAGGVVVKPDMSEYRFNRKDVYNHEGYIIANKLSNVKI